MTSNKKLLILGANSFAGGCLVKQALLAGYSVIGVNRSAEKMATMVPYHLANLHENYHFHQLDINKDFATLCQLIENNKPEYIVDLAGQGMVAESWQYPEQWYQTNVLTKVKLISFLAKQTYLARYVRVSTPEVYGSTEQLITENNHYCPSTPYAVSHAAIDMHIMAYAQQYDFPAILTRFSNFYGPTQQLYRIIPRTIIYAKLAKKLALHGGGLATRAFIYGDDAAAGIIAAMERGRVGETYHFSTSEFITIRQLVEKIYQKMSINFDDMVEITDDRPGKDLKYLMNDDKAHKDLAWAPQVSLEQGIINTIQWVEQYWSDIQQQPFNYIHKV
ncbi:GDP-mannose 4,6-dehydratase [Thalassotalea agariperforans]